MTTARTGQAPATLTREAFGERFRARFYDPAFDAEQASIGRLEIIAWEACEQGRKEPRSRRVGDHEALDRDEAVQPGAPNVARCVVRRWPLRAGRLSQPDHGVQAPRPK